MEWNNGVNREILGEDESNKLLCYNEKEEEKRRYAKIDWYNKNRGSVNPG